ncbi:MAG: protein kinase domain-containing protein [Polyangiaceae bacterium]
MSELARGATIGRYTIIRRLGSGGMGIVYLAFDPELDRRVAVKLLQTKGQGGGSEGPARLVREAQVMAKLSHPNVITVFDVGTFGDDVFVAMEYVRGVTLREWWTSERRSAAAVIAICVQAGRGLAAAHAQGILHRDFKPENILVDEQGRARVLDFGLARSGADEPSPTDRQFELDDTLVGRRSSVSLPETQFGEVLGTPAYMAPEQMRSLPVDARSDQFAFCIVAFEALHGKRPFVGETMGEVLKEIEQGRVVVPQAEGGASRHTPRAVLAALTKGLAFDPNARWRSMDELLGALERGAAGSRRMGVLVATLGGLVALAVLVFGVARASRGPVCSGADESLAGVWDRSVREEVATAFRASGSPNAEGILPRLTKALDDYAAGWVAMSTEACVATRVTGVQSDEALDLRSGCLRQRLGDVRALADLLRHADAPMVDNALGGALRLRPLSDCADVRALRAAYAPVGNDKRAAVEALRHDVADVIARFNAGRCQEAMPLATEVAARARTVGYVPAQADALYWAARTSTWCRDQKTASDYLFEAVADAEESHQDEIAARALAMLTYVRGSGLSRYEEGISIGRLAEAAIRRIGSPDAILADLAQARGWVEYTHGNLEAALPLRREAIERHRRALGDADPDALQMKAELGDLEYESGHFAVALTTQKELLQRSVDLLGPAHQRTGRYTLDVGETLVMQGKYDEAKPWLDRARPIVAAGALEHSKFVDAVEHIGLGDVDGGAAELRALVAAGEHENGPDDPYPLSTRADLVKWLAVHRRPEAGEEAGALVRRIAAVREEENPWYSNAYAALAISLARGGRVEPGVEAVATHAVALAEHGAAQLPYALLARGEAALARGDRAGAVAPLERAIGMVAERGGIDAIVEGDLALALSRALAGMDGARSKALAESAKEAYARSKDGGARLF